MSDEWRGLFFLAIVLGLISLTMDLAKYQKFFTHDFITMGLIWIILIILIIKGIED